MRVHAEYEGTHAFVVSMSEIEKIWDLLDSHYPTTEASAKCKDGINRKFCSKKELSTYNNAKRAEIESVELSCYKKEDDFFEHATVFLGNRFSKTVSLSLHGEEKEIAAINTELRDIFDGIKPWYSRIATLDLSWVIIGLLAVAFTFMQLTTKPNPSQTIASPTVALAAIGIITAVILLCVAFGWLLTIGKKKLFPINTFTIGLGAKRHELREQVRWVIVIGAIISVISSIVAAKLLS
jgi:hypothetical protein